MVPALNQDVVWCQLFSEPDAGSDAAGIKTKGTRVEGGWLVNGQKVWTSGAHVAGMGFATVRTNPDVPKHEGITTMVIDMHAEGVEVRPLRMTSGGSEFNEVFFNDVLVPDDDVVGPVDGGWTVAASHARQREREHRRWPRRDVDARLGAARAVRSASRAPARRRGPHRPLHGAAPSDGTAEPCEARTARSRGADPGPEGAMTKLILSELGHEAAAVLTELSGPDAAFMDGPGGMSNLLVLMHRAMSIAGGTSEIKRNQIGERILGLPARSPRQVTRGAGSSLFEMVISY